MSFQVMSSGCVDLVMQGLRDFKIADATDETRVSVREFQLYDNRLGEMPSQLRHFQIYINLGTLDLTKNCLTDEGVKHLVVPPSLTVLILANNALKYPEIQASSIIHLDLSRNLLDSEDSLLHVCSLTSLTKLDVSSNKLSSLPQRFRKLLQLEQVMLGENLFDSFPRVLAALPKLNKLEITVGRETVRWDEYDLEVNIKEEVLRYCPALPVNGEFDWGYARGYLPVLLDRFKNQCDSQPDVLQVSQLKINSSMLTDEDQKHLEVAFRSLPSLQNLEILSLCTNQLIRVPPFVEKFQELRQIGLCRNKLTEIPPQVRRLPKLSHVWITENDICRVHFSSGDFPALKMLNLEDNPISRDSFEARRSIDEWKEVGGDDKVIRGLSVLDHSPSAAVGQNRAAGNRTQEDDVNKTVTYSHDITLPKPVADKPVGLMQEKSVTRLREFLELPELRTTWRDLVLRFAPEFDRNYAQTLEKKVRSGQADSPVGIFLLDLQPQGTTIGELMEALVSIHVQAGRDVAKIETEYYRDRK